MEDVGRTCWCWAVHAGVALYMIAFGSNEGVVGFEMLVLVVHAGVQLKMSVWIIHAGVGPYIVMLSSTRWRFPHGALGHGERMIMALKKGRRRTIYGHWVPPSPATAWCYVMPGSRCCSSQLESSGYPWFLNPVISGERERNGGT